MCELRLEADVEVGISPQSLDTNDIVDSIETQWAFLSDMYGVLFEIGKKDYRREYVAGTTALGIYHEDKLPYRISVRGFLLSRPRVAQKASWWL